LSLKAHAPRLHKYKFVPGKFVTTESKQTRLFIIFLTQILDTIVILFLDYMKSKTFSAT